MDHQKRFIKQWYAPNLKGTRKTLLKVKDLDEGLVDKANAKIRLMYYLIALIHLEGFCGEKLKYTYLNPSRYLSRRDSVVSKCFLIYSHRTVAVST